MNPSRRSPCDLRHKPGRHDSFRPVFPSAATLFAIFPIALLVLRILVEERFLRRELPGYGAYTERVRYRLVPFLW